jgi:putative ABC transport system permease protein
VINHLSQFATLKAVGFSDGFLLRTILSEGWILSVLGYWPGLLGAAVLTQLTRHVIVLPVSLTLERMAGIFGLTLLMCLLAALLAVRKVRSADPASAF